LCLPELHVLIMVKKHSNRSGFHKQASFSKDVYHTYLVVFSATNMRIHHKLAIRHLDASIGKFCTSH